MRDTRDQSPAGSYHYEFETENGIQAREQSDGIQRATGFYEYQSPEGLNVRVDYVADENGFVASSPGNSLEISLKTYR